MGVFQLAQKALAAWRGSGLSGLRRGWSNLQGRRRQDRAYAKWLTVNKITPEKRVDMERRAAALGSKPLVSVILPVYNVDERWLRRCIESVVNQIYQNWELCMADDASPSPHIRKVLDEYERRDMRIKVAYRTENGHISAASNSALELAEGEFVVLLDHDDELSIDALYWVVAEINNYPDAAIVYSDEDLIDERGRRFAPKFKPDFSRDLFYSLNLLTHLSAFRTSLVREVGGFRVGLEGSQDYDLSLRVSERTDESRIRHIPRVLYHWRVIRGSVAFSMDEKPYAHERARQALREHFERTGVRAEVAESFHNLHRVSYVTESDPIVCTVGVTRDKHFPAGGLSRAAADDLNAEALLCDEDVLVFLEDGVMIADQRDVDELARFALQPGIGAVGGRVVLMDGFVDEAGIVLDADLVPRAAHRGFSRENPGNMFRNRQISNYSAISISCLAIRRALFEEMGGFDATSDLFDVDLCLRLRERGLRIVVLPHVELLRVLNAPIRTVSPECSNEFRARWKAYANADPFCNPNLKRDGSFDIDCDF